MVKGAYTRVINCYIKHKVLVLGTISVHLNGSTWFNLAYKAVYKLNLVIKKLF